jgi:hypothetical protein
LRGEARRIAVAFVGEALLLFVRLLENLRLVGEAVGALAVLSLLLLALAPVALLAPVAVLAVAAILLLALAPILVGPVGRQPLFLGGLAAVSLLAVLAVSLVALSSLTVLAVAAVAVAGPVTLAEFWRSAATMVGCPPRSPRRWLRQTGGACCLGEHLLQPVVVLAAHAPAGRHPRARGGALEFGPPRGVHILAVGAPRPAEAREASRFAGCW